MAESVKWDLHLTDQQLGVLTGSAFSIIYALLGLYFGALADRSDRLRLVVVGAWIWSLSCMSAAFAPGYSWLVASRGGVAVGEAIATAAAVSLIAELAGEKYRARAASVFLTGAFVGAGTAAIAGGAMVAHFRDSHLIAGWRAALFMAGLPGVMGALYLQMQWRLRGMRQTLVSPPGTQPRPNAQAAAVLALAALGAVVVQMRWPPILSVPLCLLMTALIAVWWTHRLRRTSPAAYRATLGFGPFRYLVLAFAAVMFVDYAASFWLIPYTQRRFGLGAATAGSQLGLLMIVGGIAGCLLGGWIADRWRTFQTSGRVWTALLAVLAEGGFILAALGQDDYGAFILAFGAFCISSGGWAGVAAAIAFDIVPHEHRGTGTSVYFLVTTVLGPGIGPFLVGLGSDEFGSLNSALAGACGVLLIAAAALIKLGRLLDQRAAPCP